MLCYVRFDYYSGIAEVGIRSNGSVAFDLFENSKARCTFTSTLFLITDNFRKIELSMGYPSKAILNFVFIKKFYCL